MAGYMCIKAIFHQNEVKYSIYTITQVSKLKKKLEKLKIEWLKVIAVSFDAIDMYPSIKFKLIRTAVNYFTKKLNKKDKSMIHNCLKIIKFGMRATILTFTNKYYEYSGDVNVEEKGLMIGGYKSAWLADLVAAYVF